MQIHSIALKTRQLFKWNANQNCQLHDAIEVLKINSLLKVHNIWWINQHKNSYEIYTTNCMVRICKMRLSGFATRVPNCYETFNSPAERRNVNTIGDLIEFNSLNHLANIYYQSWLYCSHKFPQQNNLLL